MAKVGDPTPYGRHLEAVGQRSWKSHYVNGNWTRPRPDEWCDVCEKEWCCFDLYHSGEYKACTRHTQGTAAVHELTAPFGNAWRDTMQLAIAKNIIGKLTRHGN